MTRISRYVLLAVLLAVARPVEAQDEINALRVFLGAAGATATLHAGTGAPAGSLGAVGDFYKQRDSPYTVFIKTGASTWIELYRQGGTDVAVADGGTGLSSWTTGDLVYASGATTLAGLADVGAGSVLVSNSGVPGWSTTPTATTFTAVDTTTGFLAQSIFPSFELWDTDSTANEKRWALIANGDSFWIRAFTDAGGSPTNPIEIQRTGTTIDKINLSATLTGSTNYASKTTGWAIGADGSVDVRYLFTDELHATVFTADIEQALAGGQIIAKSVTTLSQTLTVPAVDASATIWVKDIPSAPNVGVFVSGDWIVLRQFGLPARDTNLEFSFAYVYGKVTSYADGTGANEGTQSWSFQRAGGFGASCGGGSAGGTIAPEALVLDLGTAGNGFYEVSALDGARAVNAPYSQIVTWSGNCPTVANRSVRTRLGNLFGVTAVSGEYGLIAGTYAATNGQFLRASTSAFELHGIDLRMWDGSTTVIRMDRNSGSPYLSIGNAAPTSYGTGTGIWMGKDSTAYKFRVGDPSGNRVAWDGTDLIIGQSSVTINNTGILLAPHTSDAYAAAAAYKWSVSNGDMGISARDLSGGTRTIQVLSNRQSSTAAELATIYLLATDTYSSNSSNSSINISANRDGSGDDGRISINSANLSIAGANDALLVGDTTLHLRGGTTYINDVGAGNGNIYLGTTGNDTHVDGDLYVIGIQSDGTGKVACVLASGALGTCTNQPNGSGVCTCS